MCLVSAHPDPTPGFNCEQRTGSEGASIVFKDADLRRAEGITAASIYEHPGAAGVQTGAEQ